MLCSFASFATLCSFDLFSLFFLLTLFFFYVLIFLWFSDVLFMFCFNSFFCCYMFCYVHISARNARIQNTMTKPFNGTRRMRTIQNTTNVKIASTITHDCFLFASIRFLCTFSFLFFSPSFCSQYTHAFKLSHVRCLLFVGNFSAICFCAPFPMLQLVISRVKFSWTCWSSGKREKNKWNKLVNYITEK